MAYLRMIWMYYDNESPLENNPAKIAFNIGSETSDVSLILESFFYLNDDFWHHKRCDSEIENYKAKKEKAAESANARWKNKDKNMRTHEKDMRTHSERNANEPFFDANQEPITDIKPNTKEINKENLFEGVSDQVIKDFKTLRRNKKAAITKTAMERIRNEATKAGITLESALIECCERGWTGFKAEWYNKSPPTSQPARRQKFCSTELDYGMDGYGNKINGEGNGRIIDLN